MTSNAHNGAPPAAVPAQIDASIDETIPTHSADGRILSPEARRALAEAAERRRAQEAEDAAAKAAAESGDGSNELGGPKGPEPTRYGDWERKGIAVDF